MFLIHAKNLFQCNTELLALVQKRTTKSVRSVVIYHGLRLRMASHSVFKYKALVKRPTVAFSFFHAIQSRTILWTASLWVSVSADKASNLVKLNFKALPNCHHSEPTCLLRRKISSSSKTLLDFKHFCTWSFCYSVRPGYKI